jgi:hypothetical protein
VTPATTVAVGPWFTVTEALAQFAEWLLATTAARLLANAGPLLEFVRSVRSSMPPKPRRRERA